MISRKPSKEVRIGQETIGGGRPVLVQGMTKCDTRDVQAAVEEIRRLSEAGCKIVRLAVPDIEAAQALGKIRPLCPIPMVADIHFQADLALEAMKSGVDKLRLNPGNLADETKTRKVVAEARSRGIPIRVGVNAGSLEKDILARYGRPTPEAMVDSAKRYVGILESLGFDSIVISMKSSSVMDTIQAYRKARDVMPYPFHVGVTETGPAPFGIIKSSVGIGTLLADGIGDTIRVSLTADSVEEITVGYRILASLGLWNGGVEIISCPTCGRCEVDLWTMVEEVEKVLRGIRAPIKVAVMGCVVNGPGEAREADIGVACGKGRGVLFKNGQVVKTVPEREIVQELVAEVKELAREK